MRKLCLSTKFPTPGNYVKLRNFSQCYVLMISLLGRFVNRNGIKLSHDFGLFLYPLKALQNLWSSDVFRGYRKRSVEWNRLVRNLVLTPFNPITYGVYKMVKCALKILQKLLPDFYRVFDHFVDTRRYRTKANYFPHLETSQFVWTKAYLEPCQISTMEVFAVTVNG